MRELYSNAVVQKTAESGSEARALLASAEQRLSASGDLMHATHDEVEQFVTEEGRRIMNALLRAHFALRGQAQAQEPVAGADGRERTHVRHGAERTLVTTVGPVPIPRVAYNGRRLSALHPTDAELNLPEDMYSFEVRRHVAKLAAEVSFERAAEEFESLTGTHVALRQVEDLTRAASQDMEAFYEQGRADLAVEATSDLLVMTCDGKGVVMRHEHLRPETRQKAEASTPKLESRKTKGEKNNRKRMAAVAAVYTVAPHLRTAKEVVDGLRRVKAVDRRRPPRPEFKRVWASIVDDMTTVIEQMFDEAERRDPLRQKRWFFVADGDVKL
ncbi:MAG: ISKra4 family transposase, partial [Armatimonadetes bacterium]|nr:ISKra4 family transposase [Armatimonadota bacterium]